MIRTLTALAALAVAAVPVAASAQTIDLSTPAGAIAANRKVQCSTVDGEAVVYHWSGRVFARSPGEPDRHIFNVEGMNVRQCVTVTDATRGTGYRLVSRELMLYLDPRTNEILRTWTNPVTDQEVEVVHVANDPVNSRPSYERNADGTPFTFSGRVNQGKVFLNFEAPLFYVNPLGGDYQEYVGNQYHAMEIFDFSMDEDDLIDASRPRASPVIAWVRISPWLPWMRMGGRPGGLVFNAVGQTMANGIADLPAVLRDEIAANYPIYDTPPPGDDARPNETSWTYFRKVFDAERAAAAN
ncbi:MAG: hypothetical protein DCF29_15525 [Alphaproteobacteria bacterium]|nr:MAG: hypothetical protein DCF29_15525 [Alphaproteobacteria bacterium]